MTTTEEAAASFAFRAGEQSVEYLNLLHAVQRHHTINHRHPIERCAYEICYLTRQALTGEATAEPASPPDHSRPQPSRH